METISVIALEAFSAITIIAIVYIAARYRITVKKNKDGITVEELKEK